MTDNSIQTIAAVMRQRKLDPTAARRAAATLFAELNGWRPTEEGFVSLRLLGRGSASQVGYGHFGDHCLLDHVIWFRRDRRYIAAAGQPYLGDVDFASVRPDLTARGLVAHVPPDPFASLHFPGWTTFIVVTLPDVTVRWLPEQDGRLRGLWRDWRQNRSDYRAAAADALMAALDDRQGAAL